MTADAREVYEWFRPALDPRNRGVRWPLLFGAVAWVLDWADAHGRDARRYAREFVRFYGFDLHNALAPIDYDRPRPRIDTNHPVFQWARLPRREMEGEIGRQAQDAFATWQSDLAEYFSPTPPLIAPPVPAQPPAPWPIPTDSFVIPMWPTKPRLDQTDVPRGQLTAPAPEPDPEPAQPDDGAPITGSTGNGGNSLILEIARAAAITAGVTLLFRLFPIDPDSE